MTTSTIDHRGPCVVDASAATSNAGDLMNAFHPPSSAVEQRALRADDHSRWRHDTGDIGLDVCLQRDGKARINVGPMAVLAVDRPEPVLAMIDLLAALADWLADEPNATAGRTATEALA